MEAAFAMQRRSAPPRRHISSQHFAEDDDDEESALSTPYVSCPSSPRRVFGKEVEEAPLGEVRAAIPFIWESTPGTPRHDMMEKSRREEMRSGIGAEEHISEEHGRSSSGSASPEARSSCQSSNSEFEFSARFTGMVEPLALSTPPMSTADELFSNGQLLPLRLPPRLQAVKHMRESDSFCSSDSSSGFFESISSPQFSPRARRAYNAGVKLMPLCGLTRSPERGREDTSILGMDGALGHIYDRRDKHRSRSLSPMRLFRREDSPSSDVSTEIFSFTTESASSLSSSQSSSSAGEKNAESPKDFWPFSTVEKRNRSRTLSDFLYTDNDAPLPSKMVISRISSKELLMKKHGVKPSEGLKAVPRIVESRLELLKMKQDMEVSTSRRIGTTTGRLGLTPPMSGSNARSSARSSGNMQVKTTLRKEHMGRAFFGNRICFLGSCLGFPPGRRESP